MSRCLDFFRPAVKEETTIESLPNEILVKIFKLLPLEDLVRCEGVCHWWRRIAKDPTIWKNKTVVCSGQLGKISPLTLDLITNHRTSLRCIKLQYILKYNVIISIIEACKNLISIELIMCSVEKVFEEDVKMWPNLRKLNLKNSLLKGKKDLLIQFDQFKKLNYLGLSDYGLAAENCESLLFCYNLNHINIEKIRGLKLEYIKRLIGTKQSTLVELRLYGSEAVDDEVLFMLAACPKLEALAITHCEFLSDRALVGVSKTRGLKELLLWNNITFSEFMIGATLRNSVLVKLRSLSFSRIQNVTPGIVDVISENYHNLRFLALYQCPGILNSEYARRLNKIFKHIDVVLY